MGRRYDCKSSSWLVCDDDGNYSLGTRERLVLVQQQRKRAGGAKRLGNEGGLVEDVSVNLLGLAICSHTRSSGIEPLCPRRGKSQRESYSGSTLQLTV